MKDDGGPVLVLFIIASGLITLGFALFVLVNG